MHLQPEDLLEDIKIGNNKYDIKYHKDTQNNVLVRLINDLLGSTQKSEKKNKRPAAKFFRDVPFSQRQIEIRKELARSILNYLSSIHAHQTNIDSLIGNMVNSQKQQLQALVQSATLGDTANEAVKELLTESLKKSVDNCTQNPMTLTTIEDRFGHTAKIIYARPALIGICSKLQAMVESAITQSAKLGGKSSETDTHELLCRLKTDLENYSKSLDENPRDCPESNWPFEIITATKVLTNGQSDKNPIEPGQHDADRQSNEDEYFNASEHSDNGDNNNSDENNRSSSTLGS